MTEEQVPRRRLKVFLCTGEKSGDVIGAQVAARLRDHYHGNIDLTAIAGPHTRASGVPCLVDYSEISSVGWQGRQSRESWHTVYQHTWSFLKEYCPDIFVGITHHAFNIPLAKKLKSEATWSPKTILIGPPEVWAWDFRKWFKSMTKGFGLLPFERPSVVLARDYLSSRSESALEAFDVLACQFKINERFYRQTADQMTAKSHGRVVYVGHSAVNLDRNNLDLADRSERLRERLRVAPGKKVLGLFPGSRYGSIALVLPEMLAAVRDSGILSEGDIAIVSVSGPTFYPLVTECIEKEFRQISPKCAVVPITESSLTCLRASDAALLSSGTITLQAAFLGVPAVVVYDLPQRKTPLGCLLASTVRHGMIHGVKAPFALPNAILLDERRENAYIECVLKNCRSAVIAEVMQRELFRDDAKQRMERVVRDLRDILGPPNADPVGAIVDEIVSLAGTA